jgi:hypothetical protein
LFDRTAVERLGPDLVFLSTVFFLLLIVVVLGLRGRALDDLA